jgi:hypothetical protein
MACQTWASEPPVRGVQAISLMVASSSVGPFHSTVKAPTGSAPWEVSSEDHSSIVVRLRAS